jgi:hypothetical protein
MPSSAAQSQEFHASPTTVKSPLIKATSSDSKHTGTSKDRRACLTPHDAKRFFPTPTTAQATSTRTAQAQRRRGRAEDETGGGAVLEVMFFNGVRR